MSPGTWATDWPVFVVAGLAVLGWVAFLAVLWIGAKREGKR